MPPVRSSVVRTAWRPSEPRRSRRAAVVPRDTGAAAPLVPTFARVGLLKSAIRWCVERHDAPGGPAATAAPAAATDETAATAAIARTLIFIWTPLRVARGPYSYAP